MEAEKPYLTKRKIVVERFYNPKFGDDKLCVCGHGYYRHFDSYENMYPCGCKYCDCLTWHDTPTGEDFRRVKAEEDYLKRNPEIT